MTLVEAMDLDTSVLSGKKRDRNEQETQNNILDEEAKRTKKPIQSFPDKPGEECIISPVARTHSPLLPVSSKTSSEKYITKTDHLQPGIISSVAKIGVNSEINVNGRPALDASKLTRPHPASFKNTHRISEDVFISKSHPGGAILEQDSSVPIGAKIESRATSTSSPDTAIYALLSEPKINTTTDDERTYAAISSSLEVSNRSRPPFPFKLVLGFFTMFIINTATTVALLDIFLFPLLAPAAVLPLPRHHPQIIPPSEATYSEVTKRKNRRKASKSSTQHVPTDALSDMTLRQFLSHPDGFHLGISPSFFGYYVYFGALTAFHEAVEVGENQMLLPVGLDARPSEDGDDGNSDGEIKTELLLKSVAGASSGAMAAVLLSAGLNPRESADFASTMTVDKFWDFPGFGGIIKGDLFEEIMVDTLKQSNVAKNILENNGKGFTSSNQSEFESLQLEHGLVPVAVTGFDIFARQGKVMTKGCMGKAARASATFPGLFQPCLWREKSGDNMHKDQYLIDGGMADMYGLVGLSHLRTKEKNKRILNLLAGSYSTFLPPLGPSNLPNGLDAGEVVSISIEGAPQCGPWAMQNGPKAVEAARDAILNVLDAPMYRGREDGHYLLHIDASTFVSKI